MDANGVARALGEELGRERMLCNELENGAVHYPLPDYRLDKAAELMTAALQYLARGDRNAARRAITSALTFLQDTNHPVTTGPFLRKDVIHR